MRKWFLAVLAATAAAMVCCFAAACGDKGAGGEKLATPKIALVGDAVEWSGIKHAGGYEVFIDGELKQTVESVRYVITETELGSYEIKVRAVPENKKYKKSDYSKPVIYTVLPKLATPIATVDDGIVEWDEVENATEYEVYLDGAVIGVTSRMYYSLPELDDGVYEVNVRAITNDTAYAPSKLSQTVRFKVGEPESARLPAPVLTLNGNAVGWTAVDNATGYEVYIDGVLQASVTETSYTLGEKSVGRYEITVKATSSDPMYTDSVLSNAVVYVVELEKLDAPVISLSDNKVVWSGIANATGYEVYVNGVKKDTVSVTEYTVSANAAGNYAVRIRAVATGYATSEYSNTVTYVYAPPLPALSAPVLSITGATVSWTAVSGAGSYEVYIDGAKEATVNINSYTIEKTSFGNYTIKVKAIPSDAEANSPSELSEPVKYVVANPDAAPVDSPVVSIENGVASWEGIDNAYAYDVYANSTLVGDGTDGTSFSLAGIKRAGTYSITVVALSADLSEYKDSLPSTAVEYSVPKILSHIEKLTDPVKTEYEVGDAALDLTGLTAEKRYANSDDGDEITLTASHIVSDYDLSTPGRYELEFEYDGAFGVTVRIYVKERALQDGGISVLNEFKSDAERYSVTDGSFTPTMMYNAEGSGYAVDSNGTVAASALHEGENTVRLSDGTTSVYAKVTVARFINSVEDFNAIAQHLDGYYILCKDIDFANKGDMIGSAPLKITWENESTKAASSVTAPRDGIGDADAPGELFTGTFDGRGFAIKNFKYGGYGAGYSQRWRTSGTAIFGGIGSTGTVRNLVLQNVRVMATGVSSLVAGYNAGVIENISVEEDCSLHYDWDAAAVICAYNFGIVRNVVSHIDTAECRASTSPVQLIHGDGGNDDNDRALNGFIGDGDYTYALGEGWFYIPGYGTYFGNDYYKKVMSYDEVWYAGVPSRVIVYHAKPGLGGAYLHAWGGPGGAVPFTTLSSGTTPDARVITHYDCTLPTTYTPGTNVTVKIRYSDNNTYFATLNITIGEPYAVSAADGTNGNVTAYKGGIINLEDVDISLTMTDGSNTTVKPSGYYADTFNKNAAVGTAQNVKFYYDDGRNVFDVIISVTIAEPPSTPYAVEFTVGKKSESAAKVSYGKNLAPDFDGALTFTATLTDGNTRTLTMSAANGAITVSDYTPGKRTLTFTYTDPTANIPVNSEPIEVEMVYVIEDASDWALMNTYLDGYFELSGNVDLGGTATSGNPLVIGKIPLKTDNSVDASGSGIVDGSVGQLGVAFIGRFDGNGYKVKGFASDYTKNSVSAPYAASSYGLVPFAYIGEGGVVKNFTLDNASIKCGQCGSFIVGLNLGTVKNVVVESNCTLSVNYGGASCGAIADTNGGTIENIACRATEFGGMGNGQYGDYIMPLTNVSANKLSGATEKDCNISATATVKED